MDKLGLNLPGLIIQFVNFGILLFILWRFVLPPVQRMLDERRSRSFDIPRAKPVNSITRHTPSATPATLTSARTGRCRMLAATRLSNIIVSVVGCQTPTIKAKVKRQKAKVKSNEDQLLIVD